MANSAKSKVKTIAELAAITARARREGKVVVHCHGVFDLMHPGHIKHLEAAAAEGDLLIVTLTPDRFVNKGPGRPVFNQHLRAESIAALEAVSYVAVNEWPTAVETLEALKPSVYVKGSDYAAPEKDITGGISKEREAVEKAGGRLHFTDEVTFSSTQLLNRFFSAFPDATKTFLEGFRKTHSADSIIESIRKLSDMRVLVLGDAIIDEYHYCKGLAKPPKDNIICAKFMSEERFAGGALACANHLAGFCRNVTLATCLGTADSKEDFIAERLRPNINPVFFKRNDTCTPVKRRFVDPVFMTKLFEVAYLDDFELPERTAKAVAEYLEKHLKDFDLVLVSDFGHGFLNRKLIHLAAEKSRFMAVNAQTNSANSGYNLVTKYPSADYICIDEPEARLAAHDRYGDMRDIVTHLGKHLGSKKISITRGHLGALTWDGKRFYETPTFNGAIVDRVGAGDSYLSTTAPLAAAGAGMDVIGFVGNATAAIKLGIVCNRAPVEPVQLFKFVTTLLK